MLHRGHHIHSCVVVNGCTPDTIENILPSAMGYNMLQLFISTESVWHNSSRSPSKLCWCRAKEIPEAVSHPENSTSEKYQNTLSYIETPCPIRMQALSHLVKHLQYLQRPSFSSVQVEEVTWPPDRLKQNFLGNPLIEINQLLEKGCFQI